MKSEIVVIVMLIVVVVGIFAIMIITEIDADVKVDMGGFGGERSIANVVRIQTHGEGFKITCENGKVHYTGNGRVEIRKKGLVVE